MAELEGPITKSTHKLVAQLGSPRPPPIQHTTHRFPISFLTKAASLVALAALLAAIPSQAPEFVNHTLLTRGWELLHLLLVGIAVSYGLFSRRNADPASDKEAAPPPSSYVSQFLQVSSVFDDDGEVEDEARPVHDGDKIQMWNSQYYRLEPTVVVAQGGSVADSSAGRPLLLPIRSLRSPIPDEESPGGNGGQAANPVFGVGSCSFAKDRARHGKAWEVGLPEEEEGLADGAVLPSPIPWRSRSGRKEARDDTGTTTGSAQPCYHPLPSAAVTDMGTLRSPSFRSPSSRSNSSASSPRRLSPSPSPSLSPEMRAKAGEESGRKKYYHKSPPPPPPPPPPPTGYKPTRPSSSTERKDAKRSFQDELKDFGGRSRGRDRSGDVDQVGSRSTRFPVEGYSPGRSVRTVRPAKEAAQERAVAGRRPKLDSDQLPAMASRETPHPSPAYAYEEEEAKQEVEGFEDGVVLEAEDWDSDDASDASEVGELPGSAEAAETDENEVDKKADEFIAKFREQIRLQRIESIRRSTGQRGLKNSK